MSGIVEIHLYSQANPVVHKDVRNSYTKDGLFCVMLNSTSVAYKYPVQHIFRVKETWDDSGQQEQK